MPGRRRPNPTHYPSRPALPRRPPRFEPTALRAAPWLRRARCSGVHTWPHRKPHRSAPGRASANDGEWLWRGRGGASVSLPLLRLRRRSSPSSSCLSPPQGCPLIAVLHCASSKGPKDHLPGTHKQHNAGPCRQSRPGRPGPAAATRAPKTIYFGQTADGFAASTNNGGGAGRAYGLTGCL